MYGYNGPNILIKWRFTLFQREFLRPDSGKTVCSNAYHSAQFDATNHSAQSGLSTFSFVFRSEKLTRA